MSGQFGDYYSRLGPPRPLTSAEHAIVAKMIRRAPQAGNHVAQLRNAQVRDMPDGGMGSIQFRSRSSPEGRVGHRQIAEAAFTDTDGTPVSVTLDIDDRGELYELDFFKADGSPLIGYPDVADLEIIERHGQVELPSAK